MVATLLVGLQNRVQLSSDAILGILSHGTLAFGLVAVSFLDDIRVDLMALLFGDILAVNATDLLLIYASGASIILLMVVMWSTCISNCSRRPCAR